MRGISLPLTLIVNGATYMFQNVWSYANTFLTKKYGNTDSKVCKAFITTILVFTPILWYILTDVFLDYMHYTPLKQAEMERASKKIDTEIAKIAEITIDNNPEDVKSESLGSHKLAGEDKAIAFMPDEKLLEQIVQIDNRIFDKLAQGRVSDQSVKTANEYITRYNKADEYLSQGRSHADSQTKLLPTLSELFKKYADDPIRFVTRAQDLITHMEIYFTEEFRDRVLNFEAEIQRLMEMDAIRHAKKLARLANKK